MNTFRGIFRHGAVDAGDFFTSYLRQQARRTTAFPDFEPLLIGLLSANGKMSQMAMQASVAKTEDEEDWAGSCLLTAACLCHEAVLLLKQEPHKRHLPVSRPSVTFQCHPHLSGPGQMWQPRIGLSRFPYAGLIANGKDCEQPPLLGQMYVVKGDLTMP